LTEAAQQQELRNLLDFSAADYTLPTGEKVLWRYSLRDPSWRSPQISGIDISTLLFGLASLHPMLGLQFFKDYNNW